MFTPASGAKHKPKALVLALQLAISGAAVCHIPQIAAEQTQQFNYDIVAGPLETQLNQLAQQSGMYLSGNSQLTANKQGQRLKGSYTPIAAAAILLKGTGLKLVQTGDASLKLVAAGPQSSNETMDNGTIIVTGEKLNRVLQHSTTAVSIISADQVDAGSQTSVYDVVNRVPNSITNGFGIPNIRGAEGTGPSIGVQNFISGGRPRVTTTVDGASESWIGQMHVNVGLWDVEQVEVLRGPQSTNMGRNSIAGAIVMQTKDPSFETEAAVRAGYINESGKHNLAFMYSAPIVDDELAFRIAAEEIAGDGFLNYLPHSSNDYDFDPEYSKRQNFRGKLLWLPESMPELSAKLTLSQRKQKGEYLSYITGPDYSARELDGNAANTRYQDSEDTTLSLNIDYEFSPAWTGHLFLSYSDYEATFQQAPRFDLFLDLREENATLEGRIAYQPEGTRTSAVAGINLFKRDQDLEVTEFFTGLPDTFDGVDTTKTAAIFGESTIQISDKHDLILGGRIERESQKRDVIAWRGAPWEAHIDQDDAETMFLPKLGLLYHANPNTTFSLIARKGYNAGGASVDDFSSEFYTFDKETVNTYEAGVRSNLLDNQLNLAASIFYNDYKDYQAYERPRVFNVPGVKTYGFEVEASANLDHGLELFGSLGLLKSKITEHDNYEGNELGSAPGVNASIGFLKRQSNGFFYGADLSYVDDYNSDVKNAAETKVDDYTLVNLNAGFDRGPLSIRGFVNNLTDNDLVYRIDNRRGANVGAPRTAGIVVDYKF